MGGECFAFSRDVVHDLERAYRDRVLSSLVVLKPLQRIVGDRDGSLGFLYNAFPDRTFRHFETASREEPIRAASSL
jgi:hypothetical protein